MNLKHGYSWEHHEICPRTAMNNLTDMKLSNSAKGCSLRDTGTEVRRSGSILKVTVSTSTPTPIHVNMLTMNCMENSGLNYVGIFASHSTGV